MQDLELEDDELMFIAFRIFKPNVKGIKNIYYNDFEKWIEDLEKKYAPPPPLEKKLKKPPTNDYSDTYEKIQQSENTESHKEDQIYTQTEDPVETSNSKVVQHTVESEVMSKEKQESGNYDFPDDKSSEKRRA